MTQTPFHPRLPPVPPAGALASADPTPQALRAARLRQSRRAPAPARETLHLRAGVFLDTRAG